MANPTQTGKKPSTEELLEKIRAKVSTALSRLIEDISDDLRKLPDEEIALLSEFDLHGFRYSFFRQPSTFKIDLTSREMEVAYLAALGYQSKEIATKLDISHHTVSAHLRRIYQELKVKSRIELARKLLVLSRVKE